MSDMVASTVVAADGQGGRSRAAAPGVADVMRQLEPDASEMRRVRLQRFGLGD